MRCPSAMKCVPKVNCDFEGVMTEEKLELGPELEMLRVPLIVSSAVNLAVILHYLHCTAAVCEPRPEQRHRRLLSRPQLQRSLARQQQQQQQPSATAAG